MASGTAMRKGSTCMRGLVRPTRCARQVSGAVTSRRRLRSAAASNVSGNPDDEATSASGAPGSSRRCGSSEQRQLPAPGPGPPERRRLERRQPPVEAVLLRRGGKECRDLLRVLALAALAAPEGRIAQATAARVADAAEDARAALRVVLFEPAIEKLVDGLGQAEEHPARALRSGPGRGLQDAGDLRVVEARDDGPEQHAHRRPGP